VLAFAAASATAARFAAWLVSRGSDVIRVTLLAAAGSTVTVLAALLVVLP
jgi:hypothetical protein